MIGRGRHEFVLVRGGSWAGNVDVPRATAGAARGLAGPWNDLRIPGWRLAEAQSRILRFCCLSR
jgi:formylglycine-generating enzyme required for sulfatase activity